MFDVENYEVEYILISYDVQYGYIHELNKPVDIIIPPLPRCMRTLAISLSMNFMITKFLLEFS